LVEVNVAVEGGTETPNETEGIEEGTTGFIVVYETTG